MRLEINEADNPFAVIILAHGAGVGMDHPFMSTIAEKVSSQGVTTIRFNFPYMEAGKKFPGSPKTNIRAWQKVLEMVRESHSHLPLFMAGKSFGGRMGSHLLADEPKLQVTGIIYLGFPLHAPGKDSTDRAAHLKEVTVPQLFIQGTRDKLANIAMMREVVQALPKATSVEINEGDHSFNTPKATGVSPDAMYGILAEKMISWMRNIIG